jgi:WS/DGAT/MGAT family acyltransferase
MGASAEVLSSLDRAFLTIESASLPMHVGAVAIFEGGGLTRADGGLDVEALRGIVADALEATPRLRQQLRTVPLLGAAWCPAPEVSLTRHVRHAAIPRPGTPAQLDALVGQLFAQPLDRRRPLWELWAVEGLEGGRFALVAKVHHALVDGVAGVSVLAALLSFAPRAIGPPAPAPRSGPAVPTSVELARVLFAHRIEQLPRLGRRLWALLSSERSRGGGAALGVAHLLGRALHPAAPHPLAPRHVGPHRAFASARVPLARVQEIRRALGGTINDAVLAIVTGGLRRHLCARSEALPEALTALVPVNLRRGGGAEGNRIAMLLAKLPVGLVEPRARHAAVCADTAALKQGSYEVEAVELVEELADLGPTGLVGAVFAAALHLRPFDLVVTNVPGPPVPLFLGPARLTALYPMVPLFAHQSVGIALVSYCGELFIGVHTGEDAIPDPSALAEHLRAAEHELHAAALT